MHFSDCQHCPACWNTRGRSDSSNNELDVIPDTILQKIPGIKKIHHFSIDQQKVGFVQLQEWSVLKRTPSCYVTHQFYHLQTPYLISFILQVLPDRQWYLYHKIREFCPEPSKDATCPRPSVADPSSRQTTPCDSPVCPPPPPLSTTESQPIRQLSRQRLCGNCG